MEQKRNRPLSKASGNSTLRDLVAGGIGGAMTSFALIAGVTGAQLLPSTVLIVGLASLIADAFSLATGSFLGTSSRSPILAAAVTFFSIALAGFLPLLPFLVGLPNPFVTAAILMGLMSFGVGALQSRWLRVPWWGTGLATFFLGALTSTFAFMTGFVLKDVL